MASVQIQAQSYQSLVDKVSNEALVVERTHRFLHAKFDIDVHGDYWSLGFFEFGSHAGYLRVGDEKIPMVGRQVLFLPPFSVLHWEIFPGQVLWNYLLVDKPLSVDDPNTPLLFTGRDLGINKNELYEADPGDLLLVVRKRQSAGLRLSTAVHECSRKVKHQIDAQFRRAESLGTLLSGIHPSSSYLSRRFKKDFGLSPVHYRARLRMIQASVDLLFKTEPVESIQLQLGLEDSSYFYSSFKDHLRARPSEFKKNCSIS